MSLRFTSVDEFQFLTCVKHGLWGSKTSRFKKWEPSDHLAIIVEKKIAGLAQVNGKPFYSKEIVWDNGVFPYRIPMRFIHVMHSENRPPLLGEIRDILISIWGPKYGFGILNQQPIPHDLSEKILEIINARKNDLEEVQKGLEIYLDEAKILREQALKEKPRKKVVKEPIEEKISGEEPSEEPLHTKAQYLLIRLGRAAKCSVWVAANDQNRKYLDHRLGDDCLSVLPSLGLSDEATKRIKMIDAIWLHQNAPICAFEVEATTSIYSGLLRLSDLLSVVPAINIKLFIVALSSKKDKVLSELSRPTFNKIGLNDYCRFIAIEDLESMLSKIEDFIGHISPTVIDNIAVGLKEDYDD